MAIDPLEAYKRRKREEAAGQRPATPQAPSATTGYGWPSAPAGTMLGDTMRENPPPPIIGSTPEPNPKTAAIRTPAPPYGERPPQGMTLESPTGTMVGYPPGARNPPGMPPLIPDPSLSPAPNNDTARTGRGWRFDAPTGRLIGESQPAATPPQAVTYPTEQTARDEINRYLRGEMAGAALGDSIYNVATGVLESALGTTDATDAVAPTRLPVRQGPPQPAAQASQPNAPAAQAAAPSPSGVANDVTRIGNSYSATQPIRAGFTVNGQLPQSLASERSPQNAQAVQALLSGMRPMTAQSTTPSSDQSPAGRFSGYGYQPSVYSQPDNTTDRRTLMDAALTPYRGAQNRQLTANQLRVAADMLQNDDRTALSRYQTDRSAEVSTANAALNEAGASQRAAATESGLNRRFGIASLADAEKAAIGIEAGRLQNKAASRMESLWQRYDAAKPEDKAGIAEQIAALSGKDKGSQYTVVPGGQIIDPTTQTPITRPSLVINNATGQQVALDYSAALPPISQHPELIKIRDDTSLSLRDREAKILSEAARLGYSENDIKGMK